MLLPHGYFDRLGLLVSLDKTSLINVEAGLLVDFAYGTIKVFLILVDLASGKTPTRTLLPTLDEEHLLHRGIKKNGATNRDSAPISQELGVGGIVALEVKPCKDGAIFEDEETEVSEVEGRELRI